MNNDPPTKTSPPALHIDHEKYLHFLDRIDMTETEKIACIRAHWGIVCEFVKLGFNVHPVQVAENACGKVAHPGDQSGFVPEDTLYSLRHHILENHFTNTRVRSVEEREES